MTFEIKIERDADIEALTLEQTAKAMGERSELLQKVFQEAGETLDASKVTVVEAADGRALAEQIKAMNDELTKIGERYDVLRQAGDIAANAKRRTAQADAIDRRGFDPAPKGDGAERSEHPFGGKSLGRLVVESPQYREHGAKGMPTVYDLPEVNVKALLDGMKTTFTTSAGWAPESTRIPRVIMDAQRPIDILDFIPTLRTSMDTVKFMEETTFTNAAAERNENASYAESALALTEKSQAVESLGTSLPVTDEQLADEPQVEDYLNERLPFMVRQRLDSQVIQGNGTAPNLLGTVNVTGIQTQAKGSDPVPDAIFKAMTLVRATGRAEPTWVGLHPNDWQTIRLLRTADGIYIWGSPADAGPDRIWGKPVISSTVFTENTGVTGDYQAYSALYVRQGMEIRTGFVNNDFLQGRQTIRAGIRAAMVHYRPAAFATITGI